MKKFFGSIYVIIALAICLVPSVGLFIFGTSQSREKTASFPQVMEDGSFNIDFLPQAGDYFEQHFALRNLYLEADARLMAPFQETNTSKVVKGNDGWLYYASTVNDYQGANTMTERQVYNAVHNLGLMKDYVEGRGAKFLFTVPPNKNSLYGEHMPAYLQTKASDVKSYDLMAPAIAEAGIPYLDLFTLIGEQDEVLYLKTDSHWNNKGAFLAYRGIMDALEMPGETYATREIVKSKTAVGDLAEMVYPLTAANGLEFDYNYANEDSYSYVEGDDVEDNFILTRTNGKAKGNLLMFRDSFGNTLLPFLSGNFDQAVYSKEVNYPIEKYMDEYMPAAVVVEKVERNLREFAMTPPIISGAEVTAPAAAGQQEAAVQVSMETSFLDEDYTMIRGALPEGVCTGKIYVTLKDGEKETTYEPFYGTEESEYAFTLYLKTAAIESETLEITVLAETEQGVMEVYSGELAAESLEVDEEEGE